MNDTSLPIYLKDSYLFIYINSLKVMTLIYSDVDGEEHKYFDFQYLKDCKERGYLIVKHPVFKFKEVNVC